VRQPLNAADVATFEKCIGRGGVVVFPADTVYGLACNPGSTSSVERMHALKGRDSRRPSAIMFFQLERALLALPDIGPATAAALRALLPGPLTVVLPNPSRRFPLAGGEGLGLRVPRLEGGLAPLAEARVAVLQTSANPTGGREARRLEDVAGEIRAGADLVLDGGELSGTPSTVVDLTSYEDDRSWRLLREAAVRARELEAALRE
jgi:L-threonylcarbamoyladenylate synthase